MKSRLSALRTGRLYPPGISWYSLLEAESAPGHMDLSDSTEKIPATPGIDLGTFRLLYPSPPVIIALFYIATSIHSFPNKAEI